MTDVSTPPPSVGPAIIRSTVDGLAQRGFPPGAVALRAVPTSVDWSGMSSNDVPIRTATCVSALQVREQLRQRTQDEWLVIFTDRDANDLGTGVLAHLATGRVRGVDVWESVSETFRATQLAPSLTSMPDARRIAMGLLSATPVSGGWPAAPGGVLTREHALDSVLESSLHVDTSQDLSQLLAWSVADESAAAIARLRDVAGDRLTEACLDRLAESTGPSRAAVRPLLEADVLPDLAARGIVLGVLTDEAQQSADERVDARVALARCEEWWGHDRPDAEVTRAFGAAATDGLTRLLAGSRRDHETALRLIDRADSLLQKVGGAELAELSDLLPSSHSRRARTLARALTAMDQSGTLAEVEAAWAALERHRLVERFRADNDALRAATRLARWVSTPTAEIAAGGDSGEVLARHSRAHLDVGGWVDVALNAASVGVDDTTTTARGIEHMVHRALERREEEARHFATALAAATRDDAGRSGAFGPEAARIWPIENLLETVLAPVSTQAGPSGVLFVLLDGMSVASATSIADDAVGRLRWQEVRVPGSPEGSRRAGAVAVLPTLTTISRASLFTGRLTSGEQAVEREGFTAFVAARLKHKARLFHKAAVDQTRRGWAVSPEVAAAIDDTGGTPVVGVVLNTIDDALDRSDPGGATWTAESIKHLEPLLLRAASAGRTVVLTGDHGHIVERRDGRHLSPGTVATSNRSRERGGEVRQGDEILVEGRRVVADDQRAVLAVSERVRYGPLKAGYHGGAHPAEVVVPVLVLRPASAEIADGDELPPQQPRWWSGPVTAPVVAPESAPAAAPARGRRPRAADPGPALFDIAPEPAEQSRTLGAAVIESEVYQRQTELNARLILKESALAALIDEFAAARGHRLPPVTAAQTLGVSLARLRGAQEQAKQILNVDGYPVLRLDGDAQTLVLDVDLLCEQFGVNRDR